MYYTSKAVKLDPYIPLHADISDTNLVIYNGIAFNLILLIRSPTHGSFVGQFDLDLVLLIMASGDASSVVVTPTRITVKCISIWLHFVGCAFGISLIDIFHANREAISGKGCL